MTKIVLVIMAIMIGLSSIAQKAHPAVPGNKEFHKKNSQNAFHNLEKVGLTDDQKAQIKTLNQDFRQQMQDLRNNSKLSATDLKDQRKLLAKAHKEKIYAVLNVDQRKQMDELKHESIKDKKDKMGGGRFDQMTQNLNLTPEQSLKLKDLSAELKTNIQSIRQNSALTPDEKRDQMKSLMKKHRADMQNLLTDEQKEQLRNTVKNRRSEAVK